MAPAFSDAKAFVDYNEKGQTINGNYYTNVPKQLQTATKTI